MTLFRLGCKINLGLHVGQKRADGFHNLESIFFPLNLPCDLLKIESKQDRGLHIECDTYIPGENILVKTYRLFCEYTGFDGGAKLQLKKGIPMGAGLGGGSSDAACFLQWLSGRLAHPLLPEDLARIGGAVGSDVPFFLLNKPCRVKGRGEKLAPLENWPVFFPVLVWPEISIATGPIFAALDKLREGPDFSKNYLTKANLQNKKFFPYECRADNIDNIFVAPLHNDLEEPVFKAQPQLRVLKNKFFELGAFDSAMSGSGSTIFGLFDNAALAATAAASLRETFKYVFAPMQDNGM